MRRLQPNPETGFLETTSNTFTPGYIAFDSERKVQFLKLAKDYIDQYNQFPSVYAICQAVGIGAQTFEDHRKKDPKFKQAWDEVLLSLKSIYTYKLAEKAESKNGFMANIAILRYLETGSFVDRTNVIHNSDFVMQKRVNEALIVDVDAEIVDNKAIVSAQLSNNESNSLSSD